MFKLNQRIQKKQRFGRRKKILLGGLIVLLGLIGYGLHTLTTPVHGHAITASLKLSNQTAPATAPALAPPSNVGSTYFSLNLPAGYTSQANSQVPANLLYEQTILKDSPDGSLLIALAIKPLPSGGLTADSSYQLRSSQPANYQFTTITIAGDQIKIASATQSDGVVAFWQHGPYLATISVTTGLNDTDASDITTEQDTLNTVLSSWQWK